MTTRGQVAGSMRKTIESLREANAGLCRENQAWQDRCLAEQIARGVAEAEIARLTALLDVSERKLGEWRERGAEEKRFREALRDLMASDLDPAEWVRAKQRARAALRGGGE